jgi:hypothetical protein
MEQLAGTDLRERVARGGGSIDKRGMRTCHASPRTKCNAASCAEKPCFQCLRPVQLTGFAREHQKSRLKSIVGGGRIAKQPAAMAEHARPVPLDQHGKRLVILRLGESRKQIAIG